MYNFNYVNVDMLRYQSISAIIISEIKITYIYYDYNDVILFPVGPVTIDEYLLRIGCIQLVT